MAGIKYLTEIYKKQGKEFLDNLFKKTVVITEMLNGSSFAFEKNIDDDEISFYKRDQLNPISKIDRTLMKYYEAPIRYISTLEDDVKNEIPAGWRFGMEYFINKKPISLGYDRIPKNNLVLTYILVKDEFGDAERTISDKKELDRWADILGVEKPPILFQGKMTEDQKLKIYEFISVPFDVLSYQYGTNSFAKYVISLLNPALKKTTLNDDLDKPIEGIVFRFGPLDGQGESFNAKMIDPVFEEISKSNEPEPSGYFPNDIYGITILEVMNFILDKGLENFNYTGEDIEDRYISFICDVFEKFLDDHGDEYRGVDFEEPSFLKGEGFEANIDNIESEKTKKLISEDESYESLFKLILSAFRKLKKKVGGFFTPGSIQQFNILVREISDFLNKSVQIVESGLPTFGQFKKESKSILIEEAEEVKDENSDVLLSKMKDNIDSGIEKKPEKATDPALQGETKKRVNIVIGNFQPFNNGHLKSLQRTKQEDQLPIILAVIEPREGSTKSFIPLDLQKKIMTSVMAEYPDLIEDVVYVPDSLLDSTISLLSDEYHVCGVTIGKDHFENYVLQKKNLVRRGKINDAFNIYSTPYWNKTSDIREMIYRKDFVNFKKNAPKSLLYLWEELIKLHHN